MSRFVLIFALTTAGCGKDFFSGSGDDDPEDAGPDADTDVDTDTDADTDSDGDTDSDVPDCIDDGFEDNDHDLEAVPVEGGTVHEDLVVCDDDDDWFEIELAVGQFLEVTVTYAHSPDTDLAVQVIDRDGETVLLSVNSDDDDELLRWWPWEESGDGTYFVRVYGRPQPGPESELERTPYGIAFDVQDEVPCFPDDHEEDDSPGAAGSVPPEETGGDFTICPGDVDYFVVDVGADDALVAFAKYYSPHGHIDLEVLDEAGEEVLASAFDYDPLGPESLFGREHVVYVPEADGTFLLRVRGGPDVTNSYAFVAYDRPWPCPDDELEENDYVPWATPIEPGAHEAVACFFDFDWYAFEAAEGQTIAVDVLFEQERDTEDLDAYLFAPDTVSELDASSSADNDEFVGTVADETGTYYAVVLGFEGAENAYTMILSVE